MDKACDTRRVYDETDCALKDDSIHQPGVIVYHRTTTRMGDLVLNFIPDGSIEIKREKSGLTTTAEELYRICSLAQSLRDHRLESYNNELNQLQHNYSKTKEHHQKCITSNELELKSRAEGLRNKFGT